MAIIKHKNGFTGHKLARCEMIQRYTLETMRQS